MEAFKPLIVQIVILSLFQVLLVNNSVEGCNSHYRYGPGGVDYTFYSGMDASQHPTLSEKIRTVVKSHYGHWPPSKVVGKGVSYSHSSGHAHGHSNYVHTPHAHSHSSFETDSHQPHHNAVHHHHSNGWTGGSSDGGHNGPGYEFGAHNQPKPSVTVADQPDQKKRDLIKKLRKIKVKQVQRERGTEEGRNGAPVRS